MNRGWLESDFWNGSNAIVLDENKNICVVRTKDGDDDMPSRWMFPGGGKEIGETPEQCVCREIMEEAQVEVEDLEYLMTAWGEVYDDNGERIFDPKIAKSNRPQFRYLCKAKSIGEFIPEKDGFEIVERKFVSFGELPEYITWLNNGTNGPEFYEFLKNKIDKID